MIKQQAEWLRLYRKKTLAHMGRRKKTEDEEDQEEQIFFDRRDFLMYAARICRDTIQVLRDLNEAGGTDISARGIRTPGEPQDPVRIVEGTEEMAGCIKRLYRILRDIETIRVPEPLKPMHKELRTFGRRILRQIDDFLDRVRDGLRTIQRVLEEEPFGPDDKAENIRKI